MALLELRGYDMKRHLVPTEVVLLSEEEGHGPPCCIASLTKTPVGNPFQTSLPTRKETSEIT